MKMNKYLTLLFLFTVHPFIISTSWSQPNISPAQFIDKLPKEKWSKKEKGEDMPDAEKIELLSMLPKGERIEFIDYSTSEENDTTYLEFNAAYITYLDLDFDGDLDLLYSGIDGTGMMQMATKVYYNINNELTYYTTLRDGVFDMRKNKKSYEIYTLFQPCCDSYTTRIEKYIFSKEHKAKFDESISIIGRTYYRYSGMPNFNTKKTETFSNPSFFAFHKEFKGHYFGKRTREVNKTLKEKGIIELVKVAGEVEVEILNEINFKNETYYLVLTEPLNDLPKMPESLYEWSQGNGRRLIGWVKASEVN